MANGARGLAGPGDQRRTDSSRSRPSCERAVDVAAAQLIVRETGALVAYPAYEDPLSHPLDLTSHSAVVAARSQDGLDRLLSVLR